MPLSSKKRSKDIYSYEFIQSLIDRLKLSQLPPKVDITYIKETFENAAADFIEAKKSQDAQLTLSGENKEYRRLSSSLKKSAEIFKNLYRQNRMTRFRFLNALRDNDNPHPHERDELLLSFYKDGTRLDLNSAWKILESLEAACLAATQDTRFYTGKRNNTELVLGWLWDFSDFWEAHSAIEISEGTYLDRWESKAVNLLEELAAPINKCLLKADRITNSQIAEAIKKHRRHKKTYPQYNPYLDPPLE